LPTKVICAEESRLPASTDFAFLHGGGQGGWVWRETLSALQLQTGGAFGRALALDAPGCGAKRGRGVGGIAHDAVSMDDVAHDLIHDIEAAGLRDVVLVGHSQAGQALPAMAAARPGLFRRLVYVSCSIPLPGQSVHAMMGRSRHGEDEAAVGWPFDPATTDYAQGFPLMFCNDMEAGVAAKFSARLGQDEWPPRTYTMTDWRYDGVGLVPASYVVCLRDNILPPGWQETFATRLQAERRVYIDAGHQVMVTRPQALAETLLKEAALASL
jgi:pimeloyl-ACP methyl ester carboxylesterase